MYQPPLFREDRIEVMHDLMRAHPFALLVSCVVGSPTADHLPLVVHAELSAKGTIQGHIAKANPLWANRSKLSAAMAVFQGPQAYVTPSWYPSKKQHGKAVPTWNYAVVHARGDLRFVDDADCLSSHIPAVLSNGGEFKKLLTDPETAQLFQSRSFQVLDVARAYGVPPHLIGETEKSTSWGSGIQAQTTQFYILSLRRHISRHSPSKTPSLRFCRCLCSGQAIFRRCGLVRSSVARTERDFWSQWLVRRGFGLIDTRSDRPVEPPIFEIFR